MPGTEVSFISHYYTTMSMIRQCGGTAHQTQLDNDSEPSIKDLARHLTTEGPSSAADIVDRFLSSTKLPSFDGISSDGQAKLQIDRCNLAGVVTFDLAVCSCAVPEVSRELLRIAQGKLNSAGTKHCPQTCTNIKSFIEGMIKLLCVVTGGQSASVDLLQHNSLASLLTSSVLPLSADDYRIAVSGLVSIEKAVKQTGEALVQHSMHLTSNCTCSCTPDELIVHLADVCHGSLPRGGLLPVLKRFVAMLAGTSRQPLFSVILFRSIYMCLSTHF